MQGSQVSTDTGRAVGAHYMINPKTCQGYAPPNLTQSGC